MMWSKNFRLGAVWKQVELTTDEVDKLVKKQRTINKLIFSECLDDAWNIIKDKVDHSEKIKFDVAIALFQKRALSLYSLIQAELDEKIKQQRNNYEKEKKELIEEKIKHD